jgi:hypothetical protein
VNECLGVSVGDGVADGDERVQQREQLEGVCAPQRAFLVVGSRRVTQGTAFDEAHDVERLLIVWPACQLVHGNNPGGSSFPVICASLRNRVRSAALPAWSGRSSLSATGRPSKLSCANHTRPMPPNSVQPDQRISLKTVAGPSHSGRRSWHRTASSLRRC